MFVRTRLFIYLFIYLLNRQQKKEKRLLTMTFFCLLVACYETISQTFDLKFFENNCVISAWSETVQSNTR